ncbi:TPA: K(+)-transporting ATPase subunit F [Clostridioides difficile]|nr:K(+)-transporting ATPase subunit F [Clostridioides difficile]HBE8944978.1 K(+)-transporting ATPase subunit F [Clostridioides difficile]HBF2891578.1 K(+)-transporting ATPase subunit F [Clostridioides difficile]HBF2986114.1 K(+)-transporting ATPase subunit F [Clostridioides difficile]HBF3047295.1 K(+)-transporting ATPase subunit F [Clostridioides difficile]
MERLPMWFLAVVIIMLIIYLVYALINPEKF